MVKQPNLLRRIRHRRCLKNNFIYKKPETDGGEKWKKSSKTAQFEKYLKLEALRAGDI